MSLKNLKKPLCVASLMLLGLTTQLPAVEVEPGRESSYFPKSKIRFFDSKLEEGGVLADGMNVERVSGHTDKPAAQIAVWMPFFEPAPIEKNGANMITDAAQIYRNTGAGNLLPDDPSNKSLCLNYFKHLSIIYNAFLKGKK